MNLASTISILAGGQGSGCRGANCGRKKNLSQLVIKKEVERLTPLMKLVGDKWGKAIKQLDKKAKFDVHVQPTGLFHQKAGDSPMILEKMWGLNVWISGKSSKGEHFGLGVGLFPEGDGNTLKIQDSGIPDEWQGKGVFSAGIKEIVSNPKFDLNKEMVVHVDTNPKAWTAIAKKHGLSYQREN